MHLRHEYFPAADYNKLNLNVPEKYFFPYSFKYVAWFIVLSVTVTSSVLLVQYGMPVGMIMTYLWLTTVVSIFVAICYFFVPIRIGLTSFTKSFIIKSTPVVNKTRLFSVHLSNPSNPTKKKEIKAMRKYNAKLYSPTPIKKLENRLEDIKFNIELRNLTFNFFSYIVFVAAAYYVALLNTMPFSYQSTEVVKGLVVRANYTNTIPFMAITDYGRFVQYLNETLLPALTLSDADYFERWNPWENYKPGTPGRKPRKRQVLDNYESLFKNKTNTTNIFQRGWTMDHAMKLIGIPRLRQLRVNTDSCSQSTKLEGRNIKCAAELSSSNEEKRDFTIQWSLSPSKGLPERVQMPWKYQTAWETGTLPMHAKFSYYPGGGYILNLAKNMEDAQIILNFMDVFQWIDLGTRVIFIEFTTYSVNTNTFNVVTLIAEKSATGYIIPSYQIRTCKFIYTIEEAQYIQFFLSTFFCLMLFCCLFGEGIRIQRTSLKLYLRRGTSLLNFIILAIGSLSLVYTILRNYYVDRLLKKLEQSNNNDFVSFFYASYGHSWSIYMGAILVSLTSFKLFRLLTYRVMFYRLYTTISLSYKNYVSLSIQALVLTLAFTTFFYLILLYHDIQFSEYVLTMSTVISRSVSLDASFNFRIFWTYAWFVTGMYVLFLIISTVILVNLFIAVVCFFFHEVEQESLMNKYNIRIYLKYLVTRDGKSDLLSMVKKDDGGGNVSNDGSLLRLRGGGNQKSKVKKSPESEAAGGRGTDDDHSKLDEEINFVYEFAKKKRLDFTWYYDLYLDQEMAMKALTLAALTDDAQTKMMLRQIALAIVYLSCITESNVVDISEKYFSIIKEDKEALLENNRILEMKRITESIGRKEGWVARRTTFAGDLTTILEKITRLDAILKCLLKKKKKMQTNLKKRVKIQTKPQEIT